MSETTPAKTVKSGSFDAPAEPHWHRMISEAAYYIAQRRNFGGQHALEDWLTAEREIHETVLAAEPGARKAAGGASST